MRRAQLWREAERWSTKRRREWRGLAFALLCAATFGYLLGRWPVLAFVFLGGIALWARREPSRH